MVAVQKISGLNIKVEPTDEPDSIKIQHFIDWAVHNQLLGDEGKIEMRNCAK
jgi:hypothetical protein